MIGQGFTILAWCMIMSSYITEIYIFAKLSPFAFHFGSSGLQFGVVVIMISEVVPPHLNPLYLTSSALFNLGL